MRARVSDGPALFERRAWIARRAVRSAEFAVIPRAMAILHAGALGCKIRLTPAGARDAFRRGHAAQTAQRVGDRFGDPCCWTHRIDKLVRAHQRDMAWPRAGFAEPRECFAGEVLDFDQADRAGRRDPAALGT